MVLSKIISGGQSGADRAALDVAVSNDFPHGGWVPEGRIAEDGIIPDHYCLKELVGKGYAERTEMNVVDSDGTLIFSHGVLEGGSELTHKCAIKHRKPCLHLDLDELSDGAALDETLRWLLVNRVKVLNVAGPRTSHDPGIYMAVKEIMSKMMAKIGAGC